MNHVKELISEYIDDELSDTEHQLVVNHLKTCSECRSYTNEIISMKQNIFSTYQSIEIPNDLEQKVMLQVNKKPWLGMSLTAMFSLVLLFILSPFISYAISIASTLAKIGFSTMQVLISTMITTVPYLLGSIYTFAIILLILSVWSLRRLLIFDVIK